MVLVILTILFLTLMRVHSTGVVKDDKYVPGSNQYKLECSRYSLDKIEKWYLNASSIDTSNSLKYSLHKNGGFTHLIISNPNVEDEGLYSCENEDDATEVYFYPSKVANPIEHVISSESDSINISSNYQFGVLSRDKIQDISPCYMLKLYIGSEEVTNNFDITIPDNGVPFVTYTPQGSNLPDAYTINVSTVNCFGNAEQKFSSTTNVYYSPTVVVSSDSSTVLRSGSTTMLTCNVTTQSINSSLNVCWAGPDTNGCVKSDDCTVNGHTMTCRRTVTARQTGTHTCNATLTTPNNDTRTETDSVELSVVDPFGDATLKQNCTSLTIAVVSLNGTKGVRVVIDNETEPRLLINDTEEHTIDLSSGTAETVSLAYFSGQVDGEKKVFKLLSECRDYSVEVQLDGTCDDTFTSNFQYNYAEKCLNKICPTIQRITCDNANAATVVFSAMVQLEEICTGNYICTENTPTETPTTTTPTATPMPPIIKHMHWYIAAIAVLVLVVMLMCFCCILRRCYKMYRHKPDQDARGQEESALETRPSRPSSSPPPPETPQQPSVPPLSQTISQQLNLSQEPVPCQIPSLMASQGLSTALNQEGLSIASGCSQCTHMHGEQKSLIIGVAPGKQNGEIISIQLSLMSKTSDYGASEDGSTTSSARQSSHTRQTHSSGIGSSQSRHGVMNFNDRTPGFTEIQEETSPIETPRQTHTHQHVTDRDHTFYKQKISASF